MRRFGDKAWRGAAAACGALMLLSGPALANARICRQLETELASAGGGGGGSRQVGKYDRAIAAQNDQLSTAHSRARRAGCGFSFLSIGPQMCGPLNAQIKRMERNLDALQRKRAGLGGGGNPKRDRRRVLAALDANNCRDEVVTDRRPARRDEVVTDRQPTRRNDGGLFARLFGGDGSQGDRLGQRDGNAGLTRILNPNGEEISFGGPPGNFNTMCVRTCDGYYFPMSPRSSVADFDRDLKNCESACPGTQLRLYYQHAVGEESETMISVGTREPYTALPTAYLYRDAAISRPPGCGCHALKGFSLLAGEPARQEPAEPVIPLPAARPDPGTDPETLANADGGLDMATLRRILEPKPVVPPGERRIRVVGPVFLPDPAAAIDLRASAKRP